MTSSTGAPGGSGGGWTAALFGPGHSSTAVESVCTASVRYDINQTKQDIRSKYLTEELR